MYLGDEVFVFACLFIKLCGPRLVFLMAYFIPQKSIPNKHTPVVFFYLFFSVRVKNRAFKMKIKISVYSIFIQLVSILRKSLYTI